MTTFKKGDIVLFHLRGSESEFGACIHEIQDGGPLIDVRGYSAEFDRSHSIPDNAVGYAVPYHHVRLAPTIFCSDGKWRTGIDVAEHSSEFRDFRLLGVICWNGEASEFRNAGWEYSLGDGCCKCAESYESARAAVEEACK